MSFVHFIELVLVCGVLLAIGIPLFRKYSGVNLFVEKDPDKEEYKHLLVRKEEVLLAIKESEFDYNTQKISDEDYSYLRKKLELEAAEILEKIDRLENAKKGKKASDKASVG